MHLLGKAQVAVQIAGLIEIALVQLQDLLVQAALNLGVPLSADGVVQIHQIHHVDPHVRQISPVIGPAVGDDAGAQIFGHLIQQRAHTTDQRLERIFRIGNAVLRPECVKKLLVGHGTSPMQHQIFHQRGPLAGLADRVFHMLLVDIDEEVPHHGNSHGIAHNRITSNSEMAPD